MADPIGHTVDKIPDRDLIDRALRNLRPTRAKPLWVLVHQLFGLGSTFSFQLCRRHGFDPEATCFKRRDLSKSTESAT